MTNTNENIILPYKSKIELDAGVVYAPYVPLYIFNSYKYEKLENGNYRVFDTDIKAWIEIHDRKYWEVKHGFEDIVFDGNELPTNYRLSEELEMWFKIKWS